MKVNESFFNRIKDFILFLEAIVNVLRENESKGNLCCRLYIYFFSLKID